MNHLDRLLKKLEELGINPTPDQLAELTTIQAEIDRLYNLIVANQEAFGNNTILIPEEDHDECCSTGYCSCFEGESCCSPACVKNH